MKKKMIVIGCLLAVFILAVTPNISSIQNQAIEKKINEMKECNICLHNPLCKPLENLCIFCHTFWELTGIEMYEILANFFFDLWLSNDCEYKP